MRQGAQVYEQFCMPSSKLAINPFNDFPVDLNMVDDAKVDAILNILETAKLNAKSTSSAWKILVKLGDKNVTISDIAAFPLSRLIIPLINLVKEQGKANDVENSLIVGKMLSNIASNFIDILHADIPDCTLMVQMLERIAFEEYGRVRKIEIHRKIYQLRLNVRIYQLKIFKNGMIFSGPNALIPVLVKYYEMDEQGAKYFLHQVLNIWSQTYTDSLMTADIEFWDSLCSHSDSGFLKESISDILTKLIPFYDSNHCLQILSQLYVAFPEIHDDIVLTALSFRSLENCLQLLPKHLFKLGMLLCKTSRLLNGELEAMEIEISNNHRSSIVNSMVKKIHQNVKNFCVDIQRPLLLNVTQLLKVSTFSGDIWAKYATFFCHLACQIESFDICKQICIQASEIEECIKSESFQKLMFLLGGTLLKRQSFSDAAWYIHKSTDMCTEEKDSKGLVQRLELLATAHFKNGNFSECRKALKNCIEVSAKCLLGLDKLRLLATRWSSLSNTLDAVDIPVVEIPEYFEVLFESTSFNVQDELIKSCHSIDPAICYLKHRHWMRKWKTGDAARYHRDCVETKRRFEDSTYWSRIFQLLELIWSFPLNLSIDVSVVLPVPIEIDHRYQYLINTLAAIVKLTENKYELERLEPYLSLQFSWESEIEEITRKSLFAHQKVPHLYNFISHRFLGFIKSGNFVGT